MKVDIILVPTDFSDDAKQALETAVDLAGTLGSRVVLLHAYHLDLPFTAPPIGGPLILPDGFFVEYRNQAKLEVESAAKEAGRRGLQRDWHRDRTSGLGGDPRSGPRS